MDDLNSKTLPGYFPWCDRLLACSRRARASLALLPCLLLPTSRDALQTSGSLGLPSRQVQPSKAANVLHLLSTGSIAGVVGERAASPAGFVHVLYGWGSCLRQPSSVARRDYGHICRLAWGLTAPRRSSRTLQGRLEPNPLFICFRRHDAAKRLVQLGHLPCPSPPTLVAPLFSVSSKQGRRGSLVGRSGNLFAR